MAPIRNLFILFLVGWLNLTEAQHPICSDVNETEILHKIEELSIKIDEWTTFKDEFLAGQQEIKSIVRKEIIEGVVFQSKTGYKGVCPHDYSWMGSSCEEFGHAERDSKCHITKTHLPANLGMPSPKRLINIAPGKTVFGSSTLVWRDSTVYPPENAIDNDDNSLFISNKERNAWWLIDLGSQRDIYHIMILSRQDCCSERLRDLEIRLGNNLKLDGEFSSYELLYIFRGPYKKEDGFLMYTFIHGVKGRYLSLQMINNEEEEYLQINTVRVIALD